MLVAEPAPGAPHPRLHLVHDEQELALITEPAHALQEGIVRAKQAATRLLSMHPLSRDLPENIGEFARAYSRFTD